ncbi:MAG: DUF4097 family beta strand repeat protein [Lachnospiraceae bacterium]|nr:DUF4097 family beta strand repeat protein [Lachnospiraceae bacterium]
MKNARQVIYICIGAAMILLSVGLIFAKQSADDGELLHGDSGVRTFKGPVNTLVFEAGACGIDIVTGNTEDFILEYEGLSHATLSDHLENGELSIKLKMDSSWNSKWFSVDTEDTKIKLTIPKDAELDSALFEFGAADIDMEKVQAKKLYITVGAGELNAENLTATESAHFTVGAGSFVAEEVVLTNADLECGVGEMKVSGTLDGASVAECGVGSMEIAIAGEQAEYYGELNCGLGEIECGDIQIGGSGKQSYGTSSAERRMDIKCGIGEVDVRFYK